jgi:hypothetical protein
MFLNRPMIVILEHLGVKDDSLINLQDIAVHDVQSSCTSFVDASKLFGRHGLGMSFRLASLLTNLKTRLGLDIESSSAHGGLRHRLINESIRCARAHALCEIKHRAHIPFLILSPFSVSQTNGGVWMKAKYMPPFSTIIPAFRNQFKEESSLQEALKSIPVIYNSLPLCGDQN